MVADNRCIERPTFRQLFQTFSIILIWLFWISLAPSCGFLTPMNHLTMLLEHPALRLRRVCRAERFGVAESFWARLYGYSPLGVQNSQSSTRALVELSTKRPDRTSHKSYKCHSSLPIMTVWQLPRCLALVPHRSPCIVGTLSSPIWGTHLTVRSSHPWITRFRRWFTHLFVCSAFNCHFLSGLCNSILIKQKLKILKKSKRFLSLPGPF